MIHTPLRADGRFILDANGKAIAVCDNVAIATALATMVNAAALTP